MSIREFTTSTFYDDITRVASRTDDKNNATSYACDALNRKSSEPFADSTSRSWTYDKGGHVVSLTDQNGSVISTNVALGLDANGRLIKQTFSPGSGVASLAQQLFEYDGLSRVTKSTNDTGVGSTTAVTECSFDSLRRCLSEDQTLGSLGRTVAQSYDANSNLTTLTYPSSLTGGSNDAVTYTYDDLDRVSLAKLNSNDVAAYTFQGPGRVNTRTLYANSTGGNPVTTDVTYDGNARIIGLYTTPISKTNGAGGVAFNMSYDRANNLIREFVLIEAAAGIAYNKDMGTDFYFYDSAYRVIGERRGVSGIAKAGFAGNNTAGNPPTGAAADQRTWLLDGVTNRPEETTQIGAGTPTTLNRTINSVNEYTQVGSTSRSHDNNGSLIDDGTFTYHYDALNRLVEVRSGSNLITKTLYDAKGRRVRHTVTNSGSLNQARTYYYAGNRLIEEYDNNANEALFSYVFGGMGERFLVRKDTGSSVATFAYLEKLDGSIAAHVDENSVLAACYDYRVQGLVEAVDPGSDGDFFTLDDGVMAVDGSRGSYFANGNRHDLESGLTKTGSSEPHIQPQNMVFVSRSRRDQIPWLGNPFDPGYILQEPPRAPGPPPRPPCAVVALQYYTTLGSGDAPTEAWTRSGRSTIAWANLFILGSARALATQGGCELISLGNGGADGNGYFLLDGVLQQRQLRLGGAGVLFGSIYIVGHGGPGHITLPVMPRGAAAGLDRNYAGERVPVETQEFANEFLSYLTADASVYLEFCNSARSNAANRTSFAQSVSNITGRTVYGHTSFVQYSVSQADDEGIPTNWLPPRPHPGNATIGRGDRIAATPHSGDEDE